MQLTSTEKIEILSLDLRTNEAAIRKNMRKAGEAIFEIGKHLKHVKENVIESGKWTEWLQSMDIDPRQAQRFIQVYTELNEHATALSGQSLTKLLTLAQISSTVGDISEVIEKPHVLPNGQEKTIDEMTSRELADLKRRLAKSESDVTELLEQTYILEEQVEAAQKSERIAISQLEEMQNEDYSGEIDGAYSHLSMERDELLGQLHEANARIRTLEKSDAKLRRFDESALSGITRSISSVILSIETYTTQRAFFQTNIEHASDDSVDYLEKQILRLQAQVNEIRAAISTRRKITIIDGDFTECEEEQPHETQTKGSSVA
ncbi:DUF3102 domain-containing protein [Lysinibacillus boronitolerans]|uniref:DUF3102 domain-containing protein n=2 Tax=Lysinibacillus TaxID=400634 RepID=UPI00289D7F00|nr:DUF3102 domain-containing protein [Lysinibacillus boronitolerans]